MEVYAWLIDFTKRKDFFLNLRFNSFKVCPVGVESFPTFFEPRPEERKKLIFRKELQRLPYTLINFPSSQNSFWRQ